MDQNNYGSRANNMQPQPDYNQPVKKPGNSNLKKGLLIFFAPGIILVLMFSLQFISRFALTNTRDAQNYVCRTDSYSETSLDNACEEKGPSSAVIIINIVSILLGTTSLLSFLPCLIIGIIFMSKKS